MRLNQLLSTHNVISTGFKAFKDLGQLSDENGICAVLSTNSPSLMFDSGIDSYFAPVIPRNSKFETAQQIIDADLEINYVTIMSADGLVFTNPIIVSRHQGTIDIMLNIYPNAIVYDGDVTPDTLSGKFVIGTLPPHLISECMAYQAVIIRDFDYTKDGDLSGDELQQRIVIYPPISVTIKKDGDQ